MSSPEIALCVFFKLLPVEPILVRPHPDSNLLKKMRIFSLSCLFVCSPGCHSSERAGKDGGNLSQQGSSLHEQSQSFVSHFTSFLFIQLCSNKAQEYLVPGCFLYYIFSKFVSANPPLCFHFAIVFYILSFCNSSLHKQSQSTFRSTNPCRVQHFVFLQFVFASTKLQKTSFLCDLPFHKSSHCAIFLFPKTQFSLVCCVSH